jgi:TIR domain-containing protein
MKVFLCYASEDRETAERVQLALLSAGFDVFFDAQSLPAGGDYQARIKAAIDQCDVFVFLITENSIAKGKFTRTELQLARNKWSFPAGHVLGVNLSEIPAKSLPAYLQATTLLDVAGDPAAEVRAAVEQLRSSASPSRFGKEPTSHSWWRTRPGILTATAGIITAVAGLAVVLHQAGLRDKRKDMPPPPNSGVLSPDKPTPQNTNGPSTNIDKPTLLTSNEIRGNGVGEDISYYYTFNAGPGEVKVTVDGKNKPGGSFRDQLADPIAVEMSDLDAKILLGIRIDHTTIDRRKVERFQLHRRQQVIMRIFLVENTLDYMVRVEGPIDFSPTTKPQRSQ